MGFTVERSLSTGAGPGRGQRGTVLVISLIILMVMTLIGVTAMQTNVLEERMAGNFRDRQLAFQAAEAGLSEALAWLKGVTVPPVATVDGTNMIWKECVLGVKAEETGCPDETSPSASWLETNINTIAYGDFAGAADLEGVARQPELVIEARYGPPPDFEQAARETGVHYYTVTSLAYGGSLQAKAMVQATEERVFSW